MDREEKESLVIRAAMSSSYSHAENIFQRFNQYEREMGTAAAIDRVYRDVVENGGAVSTDGT